MLSNQFCLILFLTVGLTYQATDERLASRTSEFKLKKTTVHSETAAMAVAEGQLSGYVGLDAASQIIDANEAVEEGVGVKEVDESRHDFLRHGFSPSENTPYASKSEPSHVGVHIHLDEEMQNVTYNHSKKFVQFHCDISGQPIPNITWYRDDKRIKPGDVSGKYRIKLELWGSKLRIKDPTPADFGKYTCAGENAGGKHSTTAWFLPEQRHQGALLSPSPSSRSAKSTHVATVSESGFCQIFHSNVCVRYLKGRRVYVSSLLHQTLVEQQISQLIASATPLNWSSVHENCMGRIMEATCYYHFPICPPPISEVSEKAMISEVTARLRLCRDECHLVTKGVCSDVYYRFLQDTQSQVSVPSLLMDCISLPQFNAKQPEACLRTGSRPPVSDLTNLLSNSESEGAPRRANNLSLQQESGQKMQPPDLIPLFISFGVLILLALIIILVRFVCWHSHSSYSNDTFIGGSGAVRCFCGKAAAFGKGQHGRHLNVHNTLEMKQPIAEVSTCLETAPFVASTFPTATSPSLERRLIENQRQKYQQCNHYHTPQNILHIPPPTSPAPPPPSTCSPVNPANHRAFTQALAFQTNREVNGGERPFIIANGQFCYQLPNASQQIDSIFGFPETIDLSLQPINYPLAQIKFGDRIGQGVFGPVYAGELQASSDYENSKPISLVIKTLSPGAPAAMQTDFQREVNTMAELNHPNLLGLFGVSLQGPPWCMLFELPLFGDLHQALLAARHSSDDIAWSLATSRTWPRSLQLSDSARFHIACQVASGMEYLSSNHFIHRDLAARNVAVGEHLLCKITDLGLARDSYAMDYYRVPAANNLLLPVRWMPIDAILFGRFTVESDVWAFGVLLWEILTDGMRPYYLYSDAEVIDLVQSRYLLPCPLDCPPQVYALMLDCWNEVGLKRPSFQEIMSRVSLWHQEALGRNQTRGTVLTGTFPTGINACGNSGDSSKTNSTDVSAERPASQRISSVPMPIMASLDGDGADSCGAGALELASADKDHQSINCSRNLHSAITGANSTVAKPSHFVSPSSSTVTDGYNSLLYPSDATPMV